MPGEATLLEHGTHAVDWLPALKAEANSIRECPKPWCQFTESIDDGDAASTVEYAAQVQAVMVPLLSEVSNAAYEKPTEEMIVKNTSLYEHLASTGDWAQDGAVGACRLQVEPQKAMDAWCEIVKCMSPTLIAEKPVELKGSTVQVSGGFDRGGYAPINGVVKFDATQQSSCIFAFKNSSKVRGFSAALDFAVASVVKQANETLKTLLDAEGTTLTVGETHLCFGYNRHSHFAFHQDDAKYKWVVTMQLTPGDSSICLAHAEKDAKFSVPGSAYLFPAQAWHRSGRKERRTLTVSTFFNTVKKAKLGSDSPANDGKAKVKADLQDPDGTPTVGSSTSVPEQESASQ